MIMFAKISTNALKKFHAYSKLIVEALEYANACDVSGCDFYKCENYEQCMTAKAMYGYATEELAEREQVGGNA